MSEYTEQKELILWFRKHYPQYGKSIRLSLNGVHLGGGTKAARMVNGFKSQGMVLAESDLFFAIPSKKEGYHGLFIEMKDFGKNATKEQEEYLDYMRGLGYQAAVCEGWEIASELIKDYLSNI